MRDKLIKLLQAPHKAEKLRKAGKTLPASDGCVEEIVADFLILNGVTIKTKPRTNFDRITESEQAFVKWVLDNYYSVPKFFPCETKCNGDCEKCFIEWLKKEIEE